MSASVLRDATVVVNGNTLSTSSQAIGIQMTRQEIDDTTILSKGRVRLPGQINGVFTIRFLQNFTAVHQILQPLLAADAFPVILSISGSPVYSMQAEMFRYQPITGAVGEIAGLDVEFVGEIVITPFNVVVGVRAQATAAGRPGTTAGTSTIVVGARASATASTSTGAVLITAAGTRSSATATGQSGTGTLFVVGVRAAATATAQPGVVPTGTGSVTGVRAQATATARPGGVGMLTAWDGPVPVTAIGVRATATATAQVGSLGGFFGDGYFGDGYFGGS